MDTKQYLNQIDRLDKIISKKLIEISQLKELSMSISSVENGEKVQTSPDFDRLGRSYCKIEEMEEKLDAIIDEYVDKKELIISQIERLEEKVYYEILFERYIEKHTFEKIASNMNYSFRNTTRLHGKALKAFEKKYGYLYLDKEIMS